MKFGLQYSDPGAEYYEQRYRERVVKNLKRQADKMGMILQAHAQHE
tara:strand:+ start:2693 stop:2830 length:138 start_codon:yes stop_codon:yes gene_type:complete